MICEQLDDTSKSRLDLLMKDIDDLLEELVQEKKDSEDFSKSQISRLDNNAYLYSKDDMSRMEEINNSLFKMTPMLPPAEDNDFN